MADDLVEGRYRRLRVLGRGAMGEVWLAEDVMLHRQVALKTITPGLRTPEQVDLDRMLREARLAARLNHPHVVTVYDLSVVDGVPQVVMEYVPGRTLADEIREHGHLSAERTAMIGLAVAEALTEAHELGMMHRDVKPANIMITPRGVPKIADFGIARVSDDTSLTATGLFVGTPAFVAPEIVAGRPADARSDIWSLGVTLWTALEGRTPFEHVRGEGPLAVLGRVLHEPVPTPVHGGYLVPVVLALLERDPARRPTAAQAAQLLRSAASTSTSTSASTSVLETVPPSAPRPVDTAPPAGVDTPRPPRRRRHAALLLGALVLLAAIVVGAVLLTTRGDDSPSAGATPRPSTRSTVTRTATASPTTASTASPTGSTSVALATYVSPGGISVRAPAGWQADAGAGIANIRDYDAPGGDRLTGTYFRLGIGNPDSSTIQGNEGEAAFQNLSKGYTDVRRISVTAVPFQGVQAYDVEATGVNRSGVARHLVERVWVSGGIERIVQLNATTGGWPRYSPVFTQLVSSCTVS